MYQKLHLSKKKLLVAKILDKGGFVACILSLFPDGPGLLSFLCLCIMTIGALWLDSMYRCPKCSHSLFATRADAMRSKPCSFCPKCGWKVDIEIKP